jgi:hypothetical protein
MRHARVIWGILLSLVLTAVACHGQQPSGKKLANQDVIDMVSLGLSDDVVIDKIHAAETTEFDTGIAALKLLKAAKVSDAVIRIMIHPKETPPTSSASKSTAMEVNENPNDPNALHDPGIYLYGNTRSGKRMFMLEPTVYTQGKSGGMFKSAMTYGISKMKWKAVVRSAHANSRTSDPDAVFYFYFEEKGAGLSHASFGGTSTPNEFTLLRLEVKGDTRETVVMKANAFGNSSGTDEKFTTPYTFTKLKPGVYKVVPNAPLKPAEYCFLSAEGAGAYAPGAAAANRVFDFGVSPPE